MTSPAKKEFKHSLKQRARVKRQRTILKFGILLFLCAVCIGGAAAAVSLICQAGGKKDEPIAYFDASDTRSQLENMAKEDTRVQQILDNYETYPEDLLVMLTRNTDLIEFVLGYSEYKGQVLSDTVGSIEQGEIPLLLQWDNRWGYSRYGDSILAICGCGPTTLSMVITGLTGDDTVTPSVVAEFADANGYYVAGSGSRWTLISDACLHFGVTASETSLSKQTIFSELEQGHPVICCMRPGDFTTTGHFIVLTGIEDGKIKLNDCNSIERSAQLWDYETLEYQIDNLWVCEKE